MMVCVRLMLGNMCWMFVEIDGRWSDMDDSKDRKRSSCFCVNQGNPPRWQQPERAH